MDNEALSDRRMMRSLTVAGEGANVPQEGRLIPAPDIPVLPVLSLGTFFDRSGDTVPSVLDAGSAVYVTAGRIAIALALEHMGIKPDDDVLIPAYHCTSMVEPVTWLSANPVFYRIGEDLAVDLDDVKSKITPKTRALLAANYFGFPQDLPALRKFCDENELLLLEDCAHSFYGECAGKPLGSYGDYAIASLTKFFPVRDGGCLISRRHELDSLRLQRQSFKQNLIEFSDAFDSSISYGRLGGLRPFFTAAKRTRDYIRTLTQPGNEDPASGSRSINPAQMKSGMPGEFDSTWMNTKISFASRMICRFSSKHRITSRRRAIFSRFLEHFSDLAGTHPVFGTLPDNVTPYMFPLWADDLPRIFPLLEDMAVPMQRFGQFLWPGVGESTCPVSARLSRHVVQFPCHQELTDHEVEAIAACVIKVLRTS